MEYLHTRLFGLSRYQRATLVAIFAAVFVGALAVIALAGAIYVQNTLRNEVARQTAAFAENEKVLDETLAALLAGHALAPCTADFLHWMRRIAFVPDGVHEIIYTEGNRILCSVTRGALHSPIDIGAPDLISSTSGAAYWFDRDLGMLGFPGLTGSLVRRGNFMLVGPPTRPADGLPGWLDYEIVTPVGDSVLHRDGREGLYAAYYPAHRQRIGASRGGFLAFGCNSSGLLCMAVRAPFAQLAIASALPISGMVLLALVAAGLATVSLAGPVSRFWSLPARFYRSLSEETVVCHYQPLLSLGSGRIEGVEVLARWRDVDRSLVFPDRFLPVVEERGMTRQFTELVVRRAFRDLESRPSGRRLQVNFNIFPRDYDAAWLTTIFADFLAAPDRYEVVVELVETEHVPVETTRAVIAQLRASGIRTFIDDFGVGYSSIQYLASLSADGVKLDRSFAMAPKGSLMATMLSSAVEMIHKTGQELVVEGVETRERLDTLRATGMVDYVQGYHICRPLDIGGVKAFLAEHESAELPGRGNRHRFSVV